MSLKDLLCKKIILTTLFTSITAVATYSQNTFPTSGAVGIGTTTPDQPLSINAASGNNSVLSLKQAGVTKAYVGLGMDGVFRNQTVDNTELRLQSDGGGTISFYTNGEQMRITSTGTIGIGTPNTFGYRLAVNGDAIFTRVKVKAYANWPDYVFHNNYQLPSLEEIEQYIRQHNHLPDVPSATEVEKNGLDLGDNQALLLKKIEELTLYIIEQNKKIEMQGNQIKALEKRIRK